MSLLLLLNEAAGGSTQNVTDAGAIATAEALGTPVAAGPITASGIAGAEAFGTTEISTGPGLQTLSPSGIASGEAVGSETWCGNTYYVASVGSSDTTGTGTIGNPWATVGKAIQTMPRYGICKIRAGSYFQTPLFIGSRGDFLVMNYPGESVVIQSSANTGNMLNLENIHGISFVGGGTRTLGDGTTVSYDGNASGGLTINRPGAPHAGTASLIRFYYDSSKTGGANLWGNADKVRIRGVDFGSVGGYAIRCASFNVAGEVNDIIIEGCSFDGAGNSISIQYCDGVYIQYNRFVATLRMIDDSGDNNDNGGVHVSLQTAAHNVFVRYNDITGGIATSTYYGFDGGAVEFFGSYDCDVSYNLIYDNEGGIEDGTPNKTSWPMNNNVVHHNIFRGQFAFGTFADLPGPNDSPVILHRAGTNYKLYNNVFDLTGPHGNAVRLQYSTTQYFGDLDGTRIENNIFLLRYAPYQFNPGQGPGQTAPPLYPGGAGQPLNNAWAGIAYEITPGSETGLVVDYNNIWNTTGDVRVAMVNGVYYTRSQLTAWRAAQPFSDNDIWANPLVVGADDGDYHLEASSTLIDAGAVLTPYTDGYIGAAPDIGRFEYTTLPLQVSSVGAIASLEAFGTVVLTTGAVTISPSSIASLETVGTASLFVGIFDAGAIASEEAFGSVAVIQLLTSVFDAGGIASEEAFGTGGVAGVIVGAITPPNIVSAEAFGSPTLVHSDVGLMGISTFRYVLSLEHDLNDADALWEPLVQGGGPGQLSAAGAENLGQSRDYESYLGLGWELNYLDLDAHLLTAEFSLYFKDWGNPPTAGAFDIQIRYLGTTLTSAGATPETLPFWWDPEELTAMPLVAHLPNYLVNLNARNTFINDTLLTDPALGIDMSSEAQHYFVVISSDYLVSLDPVAEGTSEVAAWITSGAYLAAEDKLAYEPQLAITYLLYAEGTILPAGIASEEVVSTAEEPGDLYDGPQVIREPYLIGDVEMGITSEEAFGTPVVAGSAVTITVAAIDGEEAFGAITVTTSAWAITLLEGIASEEALGDPALELGAALITVDGIASEEAFGSVVVLFLISPVGIASAEAFSLRTRIGVVHAPRGATGAIEYVVEIFNSGAGFGPGTKIGELWESRNLGWSRYDRLPGKAFLTLYQDSPHLSLFSPLTTHVKITRVTPVYDTQVYAGEFIDYDSTGDDVVLSFFDYVSLFAVSRSGYKTMYPKKLLGTQIAQPEIQAALSATYSPLGFVTMGTIQDPVGMDGTTGILTNEQFGTMDQLRLQLLWDLSEMGRVNTNNHVTFEISRTPPYVVNFWKNRGVNQNFGLILNGSVDDYQYLPNWTRYRNDLATLGTTTGGGATEIVKTNETAAAVRGRRQDVATIKTLLGITSSAVELDQQHAATSAMLTALTQRTPMLQVNLVRDALAPFEGWEICDTAIVEIDQGVDHLVTRQRIVGVRGIYTEAGEDMGLILEPIPS